MANVAQFPLNLKQTIASINQYKHDTETGVIPRPDIADYCARIGVSLDTFVEVVKEPKAKNIALAEQLKIFLTWFQAQYMTHPGWDGQQIKKALIALKQDFGGYAYTDKVEQQQTGEISIKVDFGGNDEAFK